MTHLNAVLLILAIISAIAAAVGLVILSWYRRTTGFSPTLYSGAVVVASDTGAAPTYVLRDPLLGLCGKPDYLLEETIDGSRQLIPLEIKPTRGGRSVFDSDAVQLGAYLLLLRSLHESRAASFGYVRYATGTFRVDLTHQLEMRVREIVGAIRAGRQAADIHRSHNIPARCENCSVRAHCNEALV